MGAEIALINKLLKRPSAVQEVTVEAAEDIHKYESLYINNQGKAVSSEYLVAPSASIAYNESGLFVTDENAVSSGYYSKATGSWSGQNMISVGNGRFIKPYWYKSSGGWHIELVLFQIDTNNNAVNVLATSANFSTVKAGTDIVLPSDADRSTSIAKVGNTLVVSCGYRDSSNDRHGEVHEITFDDTNNSFGTPSRKWHVSGSSSDFTSFNNVYNYSDTQYIASVYDGTHYYTGIKDLGTTAVGTFAGTAQDNTSLAATVNKKIIFNNLILSLGNGIIYYSLIDSSGNLSSVNSLSVEQKVCFNNQAYIIHTNMDNNGNFYIAMLGYDRIITYKFNFDGTSLTQDTNATTVQAINFVGVDFYSLGAPMVAFEAIAGAKWFIPVRNRTEYSLASEKAGDLMTSVFTLEFSNGVFSITSNALVDNKVRSDSSLAVYSDANGIFLVADEAQLNDGDANTYCTRLDKISADGVSGQLQYSKKVKGFALEDIPAGATGKILAVSPVIFDNAAIAGNIYMGNYIATTTGVLMEVEK
jgi:hypothetical protein